jgi:hypothetical protein
MQQERDVFTYHGGVDFTTTAAGVHALFFDARTIQSEAVKAVTPVFSLKPCGLPVLEEVIIPRMGQVLL